MFCFRSVPTNATIIKSALIYLRVSHISPDYRLHRDHKNPFPHGLNLSTRRPLSWKRSNTLYPTQRISSIYRFPSLSRSPSHVSFPRSPNTRHTSKTYPDPSKLHVTRISPDYHSPLPFHRDLQFSYPWSQHIGPATTILKTTLHLTQQFPPIYRFPSSSRRPNALPFSLRP